MSGGVFICYRREESAFAARAIHDRVAQRLERENVFLDVDGIDLGVDWFNVLTDRVGACDALVAVMGRNWVSTSDTENRRRIDDPDDFVRIEIEAALKRDVRVIPVLIDGAVMPKATELPDSVKGLARRQGIEVSPARFDADVEKLTSALASILEARQNREAIEAETRRIEMERCAGQAVEAKRGQGLREGREALEKAERAGELPGAEALSKDEERRNEADEVKRTARLFTEMPRTAVSAREHSRAMWSSHWRHWALLGAIAAGLGSTVLFVTDFGSRRVARQPFAPVIAAPPDKTALASSDPKPVAPPVDIAQSVPETATRGAPIYPSNNVIASIPAADPTRQEVVRSQQTATSITPPEPTTPAGQYEMGDNYFYGRDGVHRDNQQAVVWYRRAAEQGYAEAQFTLGQFYEKGWGVDQDFAQAKEWYSEAARQGSEPADAALKRLATNTQPTSVPSVASPEPTSPRGQYEMGDDYFYGRDGVSRDNQQAVVWYRKAAKQGYAEAQFTLGQFYEKGWGVDQDLAQAKRWYRDAARQGIGAADDALKRLRADTPATSTAEAAPGEPLMSQGRKSVDQGGAEAQTPDAPNTSAGQYALGERYYYGRGVQQDYVKAMKWYRMAADQGDRAAQIMLGSLYENALGVNKDYNEARSWYQKAADQGSPLAEDALKRLRASDLPAIPIPPPAPSAPTTPQEQYEKGDTYYWGRAGVDQDYQKAFDWYQKAADGGDAAAQIMLGSLYENGLGVSKDYGRARSWYQKAADQGRPLAQDALKRLAGK